MVFFKIKCVWKDLLIFFQKIKKLKSSLIKKNLHYICSLNQNPKDYHKNTKHINNPIQSGILANTGWATNSKFDLQINPSQIKNLGLRPSGVQADKALGNNAKKIGGIKQNRHYQVLKGMFTYKSAIVAIRKNRNETENIILKYSKNQFAQCF